MRMGCASSIFFNTDACFNIVHYMFVWINSILFCSIQAICKSVEYLHGSVQQHTIANLVLIAFIQQFYNQEDNIE